MSAPGSQILAIANQKGGVGKTTTAVNLATALAVRGERILLVDLDPQGNASTGLGIARANRAPGTYALLAGDASVEGLVRETVVPNLLVITAEPDLAGAEIELVGTQSREFQLKQALSGVVAQGTFDRIVIDCPPSLGLLTLNGLVAANSVLVPLQCEFFALEGIAHLVRTIELIRHGLNPQLELEGIVLTMYDRRNNLSDLVASDARGFFGGKIYDTVIPRNVRISEAPSHGKPVVLYDLKSPGAQAYLRLAQEFLRRNPLHRGRLAGSET